MPLTLSLPEARRLAVASQGFGPRPATPSLGHLRKLAACLHAFQIDSVNVLARAHYVPAFARLGPYPMKELDSLAYGRRELFEYWGHSACLLPMSLFPLLRYRMNRHLERTQAYMRSKRGAYMARVYEEVHERGPLAAAQLSNPGQRSGNWWNWGAGKATLEHLYDSGTPRLRAALRPHRSGHPSDGARGAGTAAGGGDEAAALPGREGLWRRDLR